MSIPKRFYFASSDDLAVFVREMSHGTEYENERTLSRIRATYNRLSFHPGRAKRGMFSMTLSYKTGEVRMEYTSKTGRQYSRKVPDVIVRPASPFQRLRALMCLDLAGYVQITKNDTLHYCGW